MAGFIVQRFHKKSLPKSDVTNQPCYRAASLEVRVKNSFGHGQNPAGLQGIADLSHGCVLVRNFTQDRHRLGPIEALPAQLAFSGRSLEKLDVGLPRCRGLFFYPGEHSGLDIHCDHFALRARMPGHFPFQSGGCRPVATRLSPLLTLRL
jgi:hypothetical protein